MHIPTRDEVLNVLLRDPPGGVLDDWRVHPQTLRRVLETLPPAGNTILDVGAGAFALLAEALVAPGRRVVALDVKAAERKTRIHQVCADVTALPIADGVASCVVSRLFFGAPISQAARRALAVRGESQAAHAEEAAHVEACVWRELRRVSMTGALHLHHVLERTLYASPELHGFRVHWGLQPDVPLPPRPARAHPAEAFRYHLSGVVLLEAV